MGRPRSRYSNFGFELLGHAIAAAAGMPYAELVHRRIAGPLGLDRFYLPATADQLSPGAITGTSRRGRPRQPWTGEAVGLAGGIRATIGDLAQRRHRRLPLLGRTRPRHRNRRRRPVRDLRIGRSPGIPAADRGDRTPSNS
ncbi:serine hydrolase [Actinomadura sp. 6N118]|uniref:serine hydrolase n=1 Tax=Actinomadura sp. 6N118 TaxID=3375151 RepID=UPI00379AEEAC